MHGDTSGPYHYRGRLGRPRSNPSPVQQHPSLEERAPSSQPLHSSRLNSNAAGPPSLRTLRINVPSYQGSSSVTLPKTRAVVEIPSRTAGHVLTLPSSRAESAAQIAALAQDGQGASGQPRMVSILRSYHGPLALQFTSNLAQRPYWLCAALQIIQKDFPDSRVHVKYRAFKSIAGDTQQSPWESPDCWGVECVCDPKRGIKLVSTVLFWRVYP